jgi:tRNA-dihydrouridine synthase
MIRFFEDGSMGEEPGIDARVEIMKNHLNLLVMHYGEQRGLGIFHKFFIWYTRGIGKTRVLRDKAFRTEKLVEILALIDEFQTLGGNKKSQDHLLSN